MLKKKKKCYNQGRGVCPLVDYGGNMKKRVISIIRNIFDGVMIFVLFITTTVYALPSNGVIYDNSNSGSSATNVSEAIDDLYSKLTTKDNEINRLKGLGNVASNQMLKGYTALVKGSVVTGTIPSKGAATYTPGTTNQTIASGNYLSGTQTIKGDANLVAGNIAKGKSIFGVTGSYTSDANAVAGNILSGKTAYVNGAKISGSMIDRGLAQSGNWGCGSAGCGTGSDAYYAINGLPEGWYHSDGNSWAPEARINANTLRSQLGVSANKIAKGQSIAGVAGTYTSDANATAADIAVGKTAYVNGNKITGTGGGAKVYTFKDVPVTMPSNVTLKYGSWVSLVSAGSTYYYSINLGFTPGNIVACDIYMNGNYSSTSSSSSDEDFRQSANYAANSSTVAYRYTQGLRTSLYSRVYDSTLWSTANDNNSSGYSSYCKVSGSTLYFVLKSHSVGTGKGLTMQTRADKLTLSGTLVYN